MQIEAGQWWPICLSDNVSSTKPLGIQCADLELVAFRDAGNAVRIVEDRCPHRRAPLSLGRITPQGDIQCGYHGWTFNGESGDICGFPNLDPGERLPKCKIETYQAAELNGVVYMCMGEPQAVLPDIAGLKPVAQGGLSLSGRAMQALVHQECVAALLDRPDQLIKLLGVEFIEKGIGDPRVSDGLLLAERAARWNVVGESVLYVGPLRHRADYPLRLQTATAAVTGETLARVYSSQDKLLAEIQILLVPAARSMTRLYWQASLFPEHFGALAPVVKLMNAVKYSPLRLSSTLDCESLSNELPGPGLAWQSMAAESADIVTVEVAETAQN